jgi:flagellin
MGFRIQNNVAAMNAHRWLSTNDASMNKSLERLSSGYRINRAADDAAGLAISSNFRANIASFKVASRNTSEAGALLQVAEGGMEQIENMLVRLKELATQAASANVGSTERAKINSEGNALISEIDRIANSTKYGSTTLLDGTFGSSKTGTVGAASGQDGMIGSTNVAYTVTGGSSIMSAATVVAIGSGMAEATTWYFGVNSEGDTLYLANAATYSQSTLIESYTGTINAANSAVTFENLGMTIAITGTVTGIASTNSDNECTFDSSVTLKRTGLTSLVVEGAATGTYTFSVAAENKLTLSDGTTTETVDYVADTTHTFSALGISFSLSSATEGYDEDDLEGMTITVTDTGSAGSTFQIGAENNTNNRIAITISDTTTGSAGLNLSMDQLDTASEAQTMLTTINSAVSTLSDRRGDIGAYMNRLTYAAANLAATIENTQSAESLIRDVDMASEMTSFTKNQILLQAGTAMLAQANMAPQMVLSLFG